jgi:hypothetical protein
MPGRHFNAGWRRRLTAAVLALAAAVLGIASLVSTASAETIVVANLNDSGAGSLREAIAKAAVNDTITVPVGQITLTTGPLVVAKNLTIQGAGAGATLISGNDASRVFTITGTPTVTLQDLTVTHGKDPAGAGIKASGELTLAGVAVTGNHAGGAGVEGSGGGLELAAGTYRLIDSVVSQNTAGGGGLEATGFGGGIEYSPSGEAQSFALTLTRSRVSSNRAGGGGVEAGGFGGGIDASSGFKNGSIAIALAESAISDNVAGGEGVEAFGDGGGIELSSGGEKNALSLTIDRSAISGNTAGGEGVKATGSGGGVSFASGGTGVTQAFSLTDSTISANRAGGNGVAANGSGGGIDFGVAQGTGTATLSHITVSGNSAGGGGGTSSGAGLEMTSLGTGGIDNSIVAGNSGGNCAAPIVSRGDNIDDGTSCGFNGTGDKSSADAKLGPLGDHGGLTLTQMPLAGSPAIDAADSASCPSSDQRGVTRPQGGGCDIGAVEVPRPVATTSSVTSAVSDAASVGASVNPNFSATSYHFDYGTTTAYGNFTSAASAGEGGVAQAVSGTLSKLQPQTTYHFRIVAINAAGTVVGADQTVTTGKAAALPQPRKKAVKPAVPTLKSVGLTNARFRVGRAATAISAKLSARRVPVGTRFRFRLSTTSSVKISINRLASGLRKGRRCVAPSKRLRRAHAKRCTRRLSAGALTRAKVRQGAAAIAFSGRIGRRALAPGSYEALLSASNASGRSRTFSLRFTVVR